MCIRDRCCNVGAFKNNYLLVPGMHRLTKLLYYTMTTALGVCRLTKFQYYTMTAALGVYRLMNLQCYAMTALLGM